MDLIICLTPLHSLIASRIVESKNIKEYDVLYVIENSVIKDKHDYYFNLISKNARKSLIQYNNISDSYIKRLYKMFKLLLFFERKYNIVYLGQFENLSILFLLSHIFFRKLETFDDGIGNIAKKSIFYEDFEMSLKWKVLNIKYNRQIIRKISSKHYTIFEGHSNIIENIELISLYDGGNIVDKTITKKHVKIFLGQPIYESDEIKNKVLAKNILDLVQPDFYFPHPRENYIVEGVSYINTNLIFEDYIIQELYANSNIYFNIFSFSSTALLNIYKLPRVSVNFVKFEECHEDVSRFLSYYDVFDKVGMKSINLKI